MEKLEKARKADPRSRRTRLDMTGRETVILDHLLEAQAAYHEGEPEQVIKSIDLALETLWDRNGRW